MWHWLRQLIGINPDEKYFNGIRAIQAHLDQRNQVEAYIYGSNEVLPIVQTGCRADCLLGKWLHGEGAARFKDRKCIDAICVSCEEFQEAAAYGLFLAQNGQSDLAKTELECRRAFHGASERHQNSLARLHIDCQLIGNDLPVQNPSSVLAGK